VGINLVDTANAHGHGAAETFLGEVLGRIDQVLGDLPAR